MEEILRQMLSEIKEMRVDINELRKDTNELKKDTYELREGQKRLEAGQEKLQKNLVESIGLYTDKIVDYVDDRTEVLNKRVYKVESEIERTSRQ